MATKLEWILSTACIGVVTVGLTGALYSAPPTTTLGRQTRIAELIQDHGQMKKFGADIIDSELSGNIFALNSPSNYANRNIDLETVWYMDLTPAGLSENDIVGYRMTVFNSGAEPFLVDVEERVDSSFKINETTLEDPITQVQTDFYKDQIIDLLDGYF